MIKKQTYITNPSKITQDGIKTILLSDLHQDDIDAFSRLINIFAIHAQGDFSIEEERNAFKNAQYICKKLENIFLQNQLSFK